MGNQQEFTVTRRACLLGALLAPFARGLAALGIEADPEYEIEGGGHKWFIRIRDGRILSASLDGNVAAGSHPNEGGWQVFDSIGQEVCATIRLRVVEGDSLEVDYFAFWEVMEPITGVKQSSVFPQNLTIDWF